MGVPLSRITKSAGATLALLAPMGLDVAAADASDAGVGEVDAGDLVRGQGQPQKVGTVSAPAADLDDCDLGHLCLYEGGSHTGFIYEFNEGTNDKRYDNNFWTGNNGVDNDTSSLFNNTGSWVTVYRDFDWMSDCINVAPKAKIFNLSNFVIVIFPNTTMDNKLSSHHWGSASGPVPNDCQFIDTE